jgi:hypothetical protein
VILSCIFRQHCWMKACRITSVCAEYGRLYAPKCSHVIFVHPQPPKLAFAFGRGKWDFTKRPDSLKKCERNESILDSWRLYHGDQNQISGRAVQQASQLRDPRLVAKSCGQTNTTAFSTSTSTSPPSTAIYCSSLSSQTSLNRPESSPTTYTHTF